MSAETTAKPYAICTTEGCYVEHADREAMREHQKATMAPTGEPGVVSRSHSSRVVNPTPEEVRQNLIRRTVERAVEDATERAFEELDREIRGGRVTRAEVTQAIGFYSDFADGWSEWNVGDDVVAEDRAADEADDQQFLPWRDDSPKHRPVWRTETLMWECTCNKASASRLRYIRQHADVLSAKAATS